MYGLQTQPNFYIQLNTLNLINLLMPKKWSKLIFTVRKWKFLQILNCVHKLQYLNFFLTLGEMM